MVMEKPAYLLTVREVAETCRCKEATVRKWVRRGKLPAVALPGGDLRIHQEDLTRLVQTNSVGQVQPRLEEANV